VYEITETFDLGDCIRDITMNSQVLSLRINGEYDSQFISFFTYILGIGVPTAYLSSGLHNYPIPEPNSIDNESLQLLCHSDDGNSKFSSHLFNNNLAGKLAREVN
jgi:hypothetical protein